MKALITGASSGIGKDMAIYLMEKGYEIIAVGKDEEKLKLLQQEYPKVTRYIVKDLSIEQNCYDLYEETKQEDLDIVINNAGFGSVGRFVDEPIDRAIVMAKVNSIAVHILFSLYLSDMVKKDRGNILNVSSISGFMPGPNMASYFATKAYTYRLTQGVQQELKEMKSKVKVSVVCPSPTHTSFDEVANLKFKMPYMTSKFVARKAIDGMLKGKRVITPGFYATGTKIFAKIFPDRLVGKVVGTIPMKRYKDRT